MPETVKIYIRETIDLQENQGEPISDHCENEEALFMPIDELLISENVVDTTKELVKAVLDVKKSVLQISDFVNSRFDISTWQLYI